MPWSMIVRTCEGIKCQQPVENMSSGKHSTEYDYEHDYER